ELWLLSRATGQFLNLSCWNFSGLEKLNMPANIIRREVTNHTEFSPHLNDVRSILGRTELKSNRISPITANKHILSVLAILIRLCNPNNLKLFGMFIHIFSSRFHMGFILSLTLYITSPN